MSSGRTFLITLESCSGNVSAHFFRRIFLGKRRQQVPFSKPSEFVVENRRRQFLTEAGEPLILARSAMGLVERYSEFVESSGLDGSSVTTSALVATPMPIYTKSAGRRGWPESLNPAILWHPLFWLDQRLALRYRFDDDLDSEDSVESEDEWVVRVGLEVTLCGLYDPSDGTWLDVLSVVGLDVDDPAIQTRLTLWLRGLEDEVLDAIDLSVLTSLPDSLHWAMETTRELLPVLRPASWAILADDLAQSVGDVQMEAVTCENAVDATLMLANLALGMLSDVPAVDESELSPQVRWAEIVDAMAGYDGDLFSLVHNELEELSQSFYQIRDDYWPFLEALNEENEFSEVSA